MFYVKLPQNIFYIDYMVILIYCIIFLSIDSSYSSKTYIQVISLFLFGLLLYCVLYNYMENKKNHYRNIIWKDETYENEVKNLV